MSAAALFIVMTGLPASGKSTVGRPLAAHLRLPFLDKDDFLEAMFARVHVTSAAYRSKLSRASDDEFIAAAQETEGAVLCSHWRRPGSDHGSGTPTEWMRQLPGVVIELHCQCPPEVAARRFTVRERSPAHFDGRFTADELEAAFSGLAARGPLGIGKLVTVDGTGDVDIAALADGFVSASHDVTNLGT
jgi:shikimate kinase